MREHGLLTTFQNVRVSPPSTLKKEDLEQRHLNPTCPTSHYKELAPENSLRNCAAESAKASETLYSNGWSREVGHSNLW